MTNPPKMEKTGTNSNYPRTYTRGEISYTTNRFLQRLNCITMNEKSKTDEMEKKIRKKNMEEVEEEKESGEFEPLKFTSYENRG